MTYLPHRKSFLSQNALDAYERATHEFLQIVQAERYMLAAEGKTLAENYADGTVALICDIYAPSCCEEVGNALPRSSPLWNSKNFFTLVFVADIPNPLPLQIGNQHPVLIFNIQGVQAPDGVSIPTLVGLYHVHDEVDDPSRGLIFESSVDGVHKSIPAFADRKLGVFGSLTSGRKFEIISGEVEGCSKIVQRVSHNAHEFAGYPRAKYEFEKIASCLSVSFDRNRVKITLDGVAEQEGFEVVDVLFGPLDLIPGLFECHEKSV